MNQKKASNSVLVSDQKPILCTCYPLDGSFGSTKPGVPVAGTCGKGSKIGVPVDTNGKAAKYYLFQTINWNTLCRPASDTYKQGDLPTTLDAA